VKKTLQNFCNSLQIESMGIAPVGPYTELGKILQTRRVVGQYTEFEEADIEKRIDPHLQMEDVQSIIVCLFPYGVEEKAKANLARYTYGLDYHALISSKLKQVGAFLTTKIPNFSYQTFADTGPLVDRYLAYLAGLGFYGVNNHIITEQYGSYVVIGYMLTNYPFEIDEPLQGTCQQCGDCQRACPGHAILGEFVIDPVRCRSYLTQKKGELTPAEITIIRKNDVVFGCDICQDVCPHNQGKLLTPIKEFQEDLMPNLQYDEVVEMSNKEFMRRYGKRAFSWRGRKLLVRNFEYLL
jgi:epoxyqueuosine reductase